MTDAKTLALKIIREQELVIGPLAWSEADKVRGIDRDGKTISLSGDGKTVLEALVKQYERLFGPASREVCRDAVRGLLSDADPLIIPDVLKH